MNESRDGWMDGELSEGARRSVCEAMDACMTS